MSESNAPSAIESRLRAKNQRLRTKVKEYRFRLTTADGLIQQLQEHNLYLQRSITEHISQITSLKMQLETHSTPAKSSSRHKSSPHYSSRFRPSDQRYHEELGLSQSHAGSNDSGSASRSSNRVSRPAPIRPASPSRSSASTSEGSPKHKNDPVERHVHFQLDQAQLKSSNDGIAAGSASSSLFVATGNDASVILSDDAQEPDESTLKMQSLLSTLARGEKLDETDLGAFFDLWVEQLPGIVQFLRNQSLAPIFDPKHKSGAASSRINSSTNASSSYLASVGASPPLTTPTWAEDSVLDDSSELLELERHRSHLIRFHAPVDAAYLFRTQATAMRAFEPQRQRIKFDNITTSVLSVRVYTFAAPGSFLGCTLSRSSLGPSDSAFLDLFLVGTSLSPPATTLAILEVVPSAASRNGPASKSDAAPNLSRTKFYFFASRVALEPNPAAEGCWKISPDRLAMETDPPILKTSTSAVYVSELFGAPVTSRKFLKQDSLADHTAFERLVYLHSHPSLAHNHISSLIGVSNKQPFRIICHRWQCTLTTALKASIPPLQRTSSSSSSSSHSSSPSSVSSFTVFDVREIWDRYGKTKGQRDEKGAVPDLSILQDRILIAQDVLQALSCLHEANFIHRDLCTNSIGMVHQHYAVLAEMGSVLECSNPPKPIKLSPSTSWIAPETRGNADKCSKESDIYAFGVMLMDLTLGAPLSVEIGGSRQATFETIFQQWRASLVDSADVGATPALREHSPKAVGESPSVGLHTAERLLCSLVESCCHPQAAQRPSTGTISQSIDYILSYL